MPIMTGENGSVWTEYTLPQELKDLITIEFATTIIDELKKVFKYAKDDMNIIGVLYMNAGTSGVHEAFKNTCNTLGLERFHEASKLDWYDYDLFMDQVLDISGEVFYGKEKYKELIDLFVKNWKD